VIAKLRYNNIVDPISLCATVVNTTENNIIRLIRLNYAEHCYSLCNKSDERCIIWLRLVSDANIVNAVQLYTGIGLFNGTMPNDRKHILNGSTGNHPVILVRL